MIKYRDGSEIRTIEGQLFTGVKDRHGHEIYEGDRLRFTDKIEWYKSDLIGLWAQGKTPKERHDWLAKQPFEERTISLPRDYDWLLSSEIQSYWEIV